MTSTCFLHLLHLLPRDGGGLAQHTAAHRLDLAVLVLAHFLDALGEEGGVLSRPVCVT